MASCPGRELLWIQFWDEWLRCLSQFSCSCQKAGEVRSHWLTGERECKRKAEGLISSLAISCLLFRWMGIILFWARFSEKTTQKYTTLCVSIDFLLFMFMFSFVFHFLNFIHAEFYTASLFIYKIMKCEILDSLLNYRIWALK